MSEFKGVGLTTVDCILKISGHWLKKLLKKYGSENCSEFAMDLIGKRNRDNALNGISQSNALSRLRLALKTSANSLQFFLPYFFNNNDFFYFKQMAVNI